MRPLLELVFAPLAWIGRQRSRAVAALVLLGLATPFLGEHMKPLVLPAIVVMLVIAFARLDVGACKAALASPAVVVATTAWTVAGVPLVYLAADRAFDLATTAPDLRVGLALQAATSPMMSAPAFAALLGLDATLVLVTLVTASLLVPLTAALWVGVIGLDLVLSPAALAVKLVSILAGAAVIAGMLRGVMGAERISRGRDVIDGINIIALYVFIAAILSPVTPLMLSEPARLLALTGLAFAVFLGLLAATMLVFRVAGRETAFLAGLTAAQRNMGLMLAATAGQIPETAWLYFAVAQFPVYLAPLVLTPLARAWAGGRGSEAGPGRR
ncbi:MAG: Na+-dependent transporter [Hyphomicrobiaceae bacterium]